LIEVTQGKNSEEVLGQLEIRAKAAGFPTLHSDTAVVRGGRSSPEQLEEERDAAVSLFRFLQRQQEAIGSRAGEDLRSDVRRLLGLQRWILGGAGYKNLVLASYIEWVLTIRLTEMLIKGGLDADEVGLLLTEARAQAATPAMLAKVVGYETGGDTDVPGAEAEAMRALWLRFEPQVTPFAWWALPARSGQGPRSPKTSDLLDSFNMPLLLARLTTQNMPYAEGLALLVVYKKREGVFPANVDKMSDKTEFKRKLEDVLRRELEARRLVATGKPPTVDLVFQTFLVGLYPGTGGLPASLLEARLPGVTAEKLQFFVRE
jgi:hypothetical protein